MTHGEDLVLQQLAAGFWRDNNRHIVIDCRERSRGERLKVYKRWWRDGPYQRAGLKGCAPGERATCDEEEQEPELCGAPFRGSGGRGGASWGAWRKAGLAVTGGWLAGRGDPGGHTLKLPARGGRMRTGASAAGRARWACPGTWPVPHLAPLVPRVPNTPRAMVVGCSPGPRV